MCNLLPQVMCTILFLQMQNLESLHKSELTVHFRNQEKEMESQWVNYEKELERLRSKLKHENNQKVKVLLFYSILANNMFGSCLCLTAVDDTIYS